MKKIGNFIIRIFALIFWVVLMVLPYCLTFKIVEWIERKDR